MNETQLLQLKRKVEDAKTKVSQLQGQQIALMKQLKDDYGCKTIEDADVKLKLMNKEIDKLNTELEEGTTELEEKYVEK